MKKTVSLIITLIFLTSFSSADAEIKTFVRDYAYEASELDNKETCQIIALAQVKKLLLEELGTYLESYTEVKDYQLSADKIITLTAGIVSAKIVEEAYQGKKYYLKAELKADPDSVIQSIRNYKNDWAKTRELEHLRKRAGILEGQIEELKKQLIRYSAKEKEEKLQDYNRSVASLNAISWIEKGYSYLENKQYRDAIYAYSKAIEIDPNYFVSYHDRGLAYFYLNNQTDAIKDFDQAFKLAPDDHFKSMALSNRAMSYIRTGNYEAVINDSNKAIALDPNNWSAYNNRGIVYQKRFAINLALAEFDKAIQINPEISISYGNRGAIYAVMNNKDKALSDLEKAILIDQKNAYAHSWLCSIYALMEKIDKATAECNRSIELEPNNADLYANYSGMLFRRGQYAAAINEATKAIEIHPMLAEAYNFRGMAYSALGKYEKALPDFNRAIDLNPKLHYLYIERAKIYRKLKKYDLATTDYKKAVELNPDAKYAYENIYPVYGAIIIDFMKIGDWDKVILYCSEGIKLAPQYDPFYSLRGEAYMELRQYRKAIDDITRAMEIKPSFIRFIRRGQCYEAMGDLDNAFKDYSRSLKMNPDDGLARYHRGIVYYKKGDYDRAMSDINYAAEMGIKEAVDFIKQPASRW